MADSQTKLKHLIRELFQLDSADLDFGIYRIMNSKRSEIERFLDNDLLPQIKEAFLQYKSSDSAQIKADLDKLIQQLTDAGVDADLSPKVKEFREKLTTAVDVSALENQVFSDLFNFFRRYYNEGDFLSLRRYKEGVYAIPYEGEEVKHYWANHDQYYIKSSEYLREYTFKVADGRRVHFRLAAADIEKDNNKSANGTDRRFVLADAEPVKEDNHELIVRFEYRPNADKRKQDAINAETATAILASTPASSWMMALAAPAPSKSDPNRTTIAKHLADYTERNTFDYFIHKNVGEFLRRELDFFIKNEVMHLDDVESTSAPKVEEYLSRIKVLRRLAHKIIAFLAQLEDFQRQLWLKKKFVVDTNYVVTLDRVPEDLYADIAANDAQRKEWVTMLAVDHIDPSVIGNVAYSEPLSIDFLKHLPHLPLDTRHFSEDFKHRLLSVVFDLDDTLDGVLVGSENFHALMLLAPRFRNTIQCIYIDPPYNRGGNDFNYKDNYRHSSWLSMITDRLSVGRAFLKDTGVLFSSIDEHERSNLDQALRLVFGEQNRVEELIWAQNTTHSQSPTYSTNHEYIEVFARNRAATERDPAMYREPKPGYAELQELVEGVNPNYPSIAEIEKQIKDKMYEHLAEYKHELQEVGLEYDADTKKQDPWRGIYSYRFAEYRDTEGNLVGEGEARERQAKIMIWTESDASMPSGKQADSTKDPADPNYRFYKPLHPVTGKPCPYPKRGWSMPFSWSDGSRDSFESFQKQRKIVWGEDEKKVPRYKRFLHEVETNVAKSVIHDYTDGERQLADLFGATNVFPNPKPSTLISRFILQTCRDGDWVMDFFGGSGTTIQATAEASGATRKRLRFLVVETGYHFEAVILPRAKKLIYSKNWRDGIPSSPDGRSSIIKYMRLESYEDTLNNLELKRTSIQGSLLETNAAVREDYTLRYMLDVESKASSSLLNVDLFSDPFNYTLSIATGTVGETKPTKIDLVETFNYLLGLRVKHIDAIRGFRVVYGNSQQNEKVLVIWRNVEENPNTKLDDFFQKQGYNTKDLEFDLIYVNGDNNLENLKKDEDTWKVRLIEEEFIRLMFDVQNV